MVWSGGREGWDSTRWHIFYILNYVVIPSTVITKKTVLFQAGRKTDCPDLPHKALLSLQPICFILTLN